MARRATPALLGRPPNDENDQPRKPSQRGGGPTGGKPRQRRLSEVAERAYDNPVQRRSSLKPTNTSVNVRSANTPTVQKNDPPKKTNEKKGFDPDKPIPNIKYSTVTGRSENGQGDDPSEMLLDRRKTISNTTMRETTNAIQVVQFFKGFWSERACFKPLWKLRK